MRPFVRFGRAGLDVAEIFAWIEDPEGEAVQVYSRHSAEVTLVAQEAAKFLRYVDLRSIDCENAPILFGAAEPAAEAGPPEVKRSAP